MSFVDPQDFQEDAFNPYAAPQAPLERERFDRDRPVDRLEPFSASAATGRAWRSFKEHPWLVMGVAWTWAVLLFLFAGILEGIVSNLFDENSTAGRIAQVFQTLLVYLFMFWLTIGQTRVFIKVARGREARLDELFQGGDLLLSYTWASFLFFLCYLGTCLGFGIVLGLMLPLVNMAAGEAGSFASIAVLIVGIVAIVIGAIYCISRLYMYQYVLVDRRISGYASLSMASRITQGRVIDIVLLSLFSGLIAFLGFLVCGVGIIVTLPLAMLIPASGYTLLAGEYWGKSSVGERDEPELIL